MAQLKGQVKGKLLLVSGQDQRLSPIWEKVGQLNFLCVFEIVHTFIIYNFFY